MFSEEPPSDVYLDTSILVNALIDGLAQSDICYQAYEYLVTHRSTVYLSHLTRLEYLEAVRSLAHKASLPESFRQQFELENWENVRVRRRWLEYWARELDDFLDRFHLVHELPFHDRIRAELPGQMAEGPLRAYDAFHLATAVYYRVSEFWTTDRDFRRISSDTRVRIFGRGR